MSPAATVLSSEQDKVPAYTAPTEYDTSGKKCHRGEKAGEETASRVWAALVSRARRGPERARPERGGRAGEELSGGSF